MLSLHVDVQTDDCRVVAMRGSGMRGRERVWGSALCAQAKFLQVSPSEAGSHAAFVLMHGPVLFYMQERAFATAYCAPCTSKALSQRTYSQ